MPFTLPLTSPNRWEVFAADDTSAQVVWRRLGDGEVRLRVEGEEFATHQPGSLGTHTVTGLAPETSYDAWIEVGERTAGPVELTTGPSLAGERHLRVATMSDIHFGEDGFGLIRQLRDRELGAGYPMRCALAAVHEMTAWGADLLVIKGDLTNDSAPEQWQQVDAFLDAVDIPVVALPGNHDTVGKRWSLDAHDELERRGLWSESVHVIEHPGIRIVTLDTTVPTRGYGRLRHHLDDLLRAVDTPDPVLLFTHHHFEATLVPWFWPLGVPRHHGTSILDRLLEVNPDLVVSSGHTHRNRVRQYGSALVTEVGSVKDYPGVWAGYDIHGDGIRQTLRRVSEPGCLAWTERTRAAVAGIWGRWSPGQMSDRCVTHRFGDRREPVTSAAAARTTG